MGRRQRVKERERERREGDRRSFDWTVASAQPFVTAWQKCLVSLLLSPTMSLDLWHEAAYLFHWLSRCPRRREGMNGNLGMFGQRLWQT